MRQGGFALAQSDRLLVPLAPVTGTIASGVSEDWEVAAPAGAVFSLFARSTDGTLDPVLTILEGTAVLLSNDDYAYPDTRDAGLEAITLPRTGTYTVRVSGFGGSAGDYSLILLPGYGEDALLDEFDGIANWESANPDLILDGADSQMSLTLNGFERAATLTRSAATFEQYYARAVFTDVSARGSWQVSLLGRVGSDGGYAFEVNNQGLWRFVRVSGGVSSALRDWTTHPAIRAGEQRFTLGMMANRDHFDLFYNEQFIGTVRDTTFLRPGTVGIGLRTGTALDSTVTVRLTSISVTIPVTPAIFPGQLSVSSDGAAMTRELQRRGLIAPTEPRLTVGESFVDLARAGVNALPLARGESYENFALAANVTAESSYQGAPAGCGLVFGIQDATHYTLAYLMRNGDFGVSPRLGEIFAPGIAGSLAAPAPSSQHLLVVVRAGDLHYFINGLIAGSLSNAVTPAGGIGVAVVNEAPVTTTCRFRDVWLAEL